MYARLQSGFPLGLLAVLFVAVAGCGALRGETADPSEPEAPPAPEEAEPDDPYEEIVEEAEHLEGFFDLYRTDAGRLYMAVSEERLGEEFLMEYKIAQGLGAGGIYGGAMLSLFEGEVVFLRRQDETVYLMQEPHRFRAEEGTPQERAVELSFTPSIKESAEIAATREEDERHLIDVTDWFVGDLSGVSQMLRGVGATGPGQLGPPPSFDPGRSYLEEVKAFPKNLNVRSVLTYRPQEPVSLAALADGRFLTLAVHHTIAELPEEPMEPRLADERMGYFVNAHKDFTDGEDTYFVRHVNRWRLEPGDPAEDGLVYPEEPIVYYLDRTIPEDFIPHFREGIEAWQDAFEEAGFKDAIRAERLPEDADPDDIRYPTLRWNTSDQPGYSAIGPSVVDPRTGEILDANQLYEANMILGFQSGWRNMVEPQTSLDLALGVLDGDPELGREALENHHHLAGVLSDQGLLLRAFMAAQGELAPGEPLPEEYLGEAIRWVVMHEVGHTLGLRHNFRASTDTPHEKLHDREWAREEGLVSSVMDYHSPNVAPDLDEQGYFYTPTVGSADRWKIAYGYTPDPDRARELARLAEKDGRTYGTDEDAGGPGAMDPSVNLYDLSDDPLAWGMERTELIGGLWRELPENVLEDDARYADLTSAFQALVGQYSQALAPAVKYVGGEYVYRTRPGDPADQGPFVPVDGREQEEALDFLAENAFGEKAFALPEGMLARFGPDRWSHWGHSNTHQGRIDFPFHEQITGLQGTLLGQLMNPYRLSRMRDAELRYGSNRVLTIPAMMETLSEAVWAEVWEGTPRDVNSLRRDLQRSHLDALGEIVVEPADRTPADAQAVARRTLRDLDGRLRAALEAGAGLDAYTLAHLEEARAWIDRILEAGVTVAR